MSFNFIDDVKDISEEYITRTLKKHYNSSITAALTPLMVKTLTYDFKQKAKNLNWLFNGKTTVSISPDPEKTLKDLMQNNSGGINVLIDFLNGIGATYTAALLQESKCIYNKQEMRITRVIEMLPNITDIVQAMLQGNSLRGNLIQDELLPYVKSTIAAKTETIMYSTKSSHSIRYGKDATDGTNIWIQQSNGFYECYPNKNYQAVVKRPIDDYDIHDITKQIDGSTVVLSIDPNDFITASNGGVSSCFGFSGMHHLGWMNYWRADFGIIAYVKNSNDRMYKTGRQWLLMKMTENNQMFEAPAFKFQKPYGKLTLAHTKLVEDFVFGKIKEAFGFTRNQFTRISSGSLQKASVSDTCMTTQGSHGIHSGYTDTSFMDSAPGYQLKADTAYKGQYVAFPYLVSDNYHDGRSMIFNFPDALNMQGIPTNNGGFTANQTHRSKSSLGVIPPAKLVTCAATKKEVLDKECVQMPDGSFVLTEVLIKQYDPSAIPDIAKKEETVIVQEEVQTYDMDFDEDDF